MLIFQRILQRPRFVISLAAVLFMVYYLWLVITLKHEVPGGVVGRQWAAVSWLVVLFTIGYLSTPFFSSLPVESLHILVSVIFLFGAICVAITVKMIFRIIKITSD